jgi:hypothetical protein
VTTQTPSPSTDASLIRLRGLSKSYARGGETLRILDGLDLDVPRGS